MTALDAARREWRGADAVLRALAGTRARDDADLWRAAVALIVASVRLGDAERAAAGAASSAAERRRALGIA